MTITLHSEEVAFETSTPFTLKDVPEARRHPIRGRGYLYRPEVAEGETDPRPKRPAVVVSQGLGGLKQAREHTYGRRLAEHGYVALVVDSFAVRGKDHDSHSKRALAATESTMLADAFAALRTLAHRPDVDPDRIGIVGFSYGGMITVLTAYEQMRRLFLDGTPDANLKFAAHASFYGSSVPRLDDPTATGAPVLILNGALDANVSLKRTGQIAEDLRRGGSPVEEVVLPGTYHQWDSDDATPRFVRWSIKNVKMRVKRDNTIRDEITGIEVRGKASRTIAIGAGTSPRGYLIKMDAEATQKSLDRMFTHFDRTFGWQPEEGARTAVAAPERGVDGAAVTSP
ncbi:dienelactone hydrolase [Caenispirillum salinarum AK4]|uniref:Dienelactone hydrolase n=1 Tax=Caenispirillum salinarum AK4 TaxID=1238182 RepID=K9HMA6_9PROT|nr:dienelactone hydrolase family protein [Caenispirillum salinarum]EKV31483.1 dienelactone hydrolase [Caenispirillum salinarum AK4]